VQSRAQRHASRYRRGQENPSEFACSHAGQRLRSTTAQSMCCDGPLFSCKYTNHARSLWLFCSMWCLLCGSYSPCLVITVLWGTALQVLQRVPPCAACRAPQSVLRAARRVLSFSVCCSARCTTAWCAEHGAPSAHPSLQVHLDCQPGR